MRGGEASVAPRNRPPHRLVLSLSKGRSALLPAGEKRVSPTGAAWVAAEASNAVHPILAVLLLAYLRSLVHIGGYMYA